MNFSNLNDEDLLRQARDHNDPLVQELAKRLAERIDGVEYREPSHWHLARVLPVGCIRS